MTTSTRTHTAASPLHPWVPGLGGYSVCRYGCGATKAGPPAPSVQGSRTSEAAARRIEGSPRAAAKAAVLAAIRQSVDGLTAEKIEQVTGMGGSTVRPRIVELERDQSIRKSGKKRLTRSGREAEVYVAVV